MGTKNKYHLLTIFIIFVVISFILVLKYYNANNYSSELVNVEYLSDSNIKIDSSLILDDEAGKNIKSDREDFIEFRINSSENHNVKYTIYLVKDDLVSEIPEKFIKVYLTDENNKFLTNSSSKLIPTYYELKSLDNTVNGKIVYSGVLKPYEIKKFKLKVWIADTYEILSDKKFFSFKIDVLI